MSEYANIKIKKLSLVSFRNYVDKYVVGLLFSNGDLIINPGFKPHPEDEDSEEYTQYIYRTTVKKAIERLEVRGFSIENFKNTFEKNKEPAINYHAFYFYSKKYSSCDEDAFVSKLNQNITFNKWQNAVRKIVSYELENGNITQYCDITMHDVNIKTFTEKVIFCSMKMDWLGSFYGLYTDIIDIGYIIRLILENCDYNEIIELDFSYLQFWSDDSVSLAMSATQNVEKIIVLVEGTSDKDILEYSLSKLYPHLSDLFYFMDFDDSNGGKRDGGTSYVIKNLKTFYFSKLQAKFIAVFYNDAEGYQSQCVLLNEVKQWPDNYRILLYPEISLFKKYPTLASNGNIILDNINHKACSIELYLPDDIIKINEKYLPIEWESRKKIKTTGGEEELLYQGVISQKDYIKKRLQKLRKSIKNGEKLFIAQDWFSMQQLLEKIIFAFRK